MCRRENLNQVDLLTPAERKITEKEYWANRKGQEKLDTKNQRMIADGVTPRNTKFQTQKQFYGTPLIVPFHQRILWKNFKRFFLKSMGYL